MGRWPVIEFGSSREFTGPPLTREMVLRAEATLGVKLPETYVALLGVQNGGSPARRCIRTTFPTLWAPNYFELRGIAGIGGDYGIERSRYQVREWGYAVMGVVIGITPLAGHDAVMLDYSSGPSDPSVAYVTEGGPAYTIAPTFDAFADLLVACPDPEIGFN